jgi:WD40 repeat protein
MQRRWTAPFFETVLKLDTSRLERGVLARRSAGGNGKQCKTARVWNAATGQVIAKLEGHSGLVLSAAFSPDGRRVATASEDKTARV